MRTSVLSHLSVAVLALSLAVGAVAAPTPQLRPMQLQTLRPVDLTALTPTRLVQDFDTALRTNEVPAATRQAILAQYRELPDDLKLSLLETFDPSYAEAARRPDIYIKRVEPEWIGRLIMRLFWISSFWPSQGTPNGWSYAFGTGFSSNCKVYFDGVQVESHYLDWDIEFFPRSMAFKVPANAARAQEHQVFVRDMTSNRDTATVAYEIVAPRGYRGYHGWKFSNFSRPTIDWKLYAHYFGASNVEYPDGTHRPAAQQWYDNAYSKAGSGGNCYGMSVSSLRIRNHEFDHMFHANYFTNSGTAQPWCWWYDWNDTTRETVQEQQGAWYTQEVLDTHTNLYNSQDPRALFTRCQSLVSDPINRPVLVVWGNGWGHAVVPYQTEIEGNTRRMFVYDNNHPYREDETGSSDPNLAVVNWSANTFAFGSASKGVLMSYEECTPPNPHLPGSEYGGPGAQAAVVVFSPEAQVQQIVDEQGRRFFNPDGSINEDPNTRIPLSMRMYPLVQRGPVLRLPQLPQQGELLQMLQRMPSGPSIFVFSQAQGKSLTFTVAGEGARSANIFMNGRVFSLEMAGAGQFQVAGIGLVPTLEITEPAVLAPVSLRYIRSRPGGDRMFDLRNLRNLGDQPLRVTPSEDGRELEIQAVPGVLFNLDIQGPTGRGIHAAAYQDVLLAEGGAMRLRPANWGQLSSSQLRVQLRNIQTNRQLRQFNIEPVR